MHVAQDAVDPLTPGDLVGPVQSQETFACDSESASFGWVEVDCLEVGSGGGATPFQVNLDVGFADIGDALEVAVYDGVGNVARRTVY